MRAAARTALARLRSDRHRNRRWSLLETGLVLMARAAIRRAKARATKEKAMAASECCLGHSILKRNLANRFAQTSMLQAAVPKGQTPRASSAAPKAFTIAGPRDAFAGTPMASLPIQRPMIEAKWLLQDLYLHRQGLQQKPLMPAGVRKCLLCRE